MNIMENKETQKAKKEIKSKKANKVWNFIKLLWIDSENVPHMHVVSETPPK